MKNCDPLEQAEFICNIGQRIRNYFWGNISRKMAAGTKSGTMELLSLTQLQLLDTVTAHGRITITELARNMGVSPPSTSAMVDRMVNCGWLHRGISWVFKKSCVKRSLILSRPSDRKQHKNGAMF